MAMRHLVLTLVFAVFSLSSCAYAESADETIRYKMTVEVETPEGIKTGSAIREVSLHGGWSALPEMGPRLTLKGEAVVVDLGSRGVLFALLSGYKTGVDYAQGLPGQVFFPQGGWLSAEGFKRLKSIKSGPVVLEPEWYPMFVHFRNVKDPTTVEMVIEMKSCAEVNSGQPRNNLCVSKDRFGEVFGSGVRLNSVLMEMVDKEVPVPYVTNWLPWLDERAKLPGYLGSGPKKISEDPTNTWLTTGSFKKGTKAESADRLR